MRGLTIVAVGVLTLAGCDKKPEVPAATTSVAAVTPAQPGKDWTQEMAATPGGGFRLGNPAAKVKLVEYASLTCPHCRDFAEQADAPLRAKYIAAGNVSYEFRNFWLNGPDLAASVLARCEGPRPFFNLLRAFFEAQPQWTEPFTKLTEADSKRLGALPQDQQIAALAKLGGLDSFMRARGMTSAKFDQCLADPAALKTLLGIRDAATKLGVDSTPSFFINDAKQEGTTTWPQLEAKLLAALQ